jgi:hypothetical protein
MPEAPAMPAAKPLIARTATAAISAADANSAGAQL